LRRVNSLRGGLDFDYASLAWCMLLVRLSFPRGIRRPVGVLHYLSILTMPTAASGSPGPVNSNPRTCLVAVMEAMILAIIGVFLAS
jgi:hypothetical protein